MKTVKKFIAIIFFLIIPIICVAQKKWVAPSSASEVTNPHRDDPKATVTGKKLFNGYCTVCHGTKGKGDGMVSVGLRPKPSDLSSQKVQAQSDGSIFWKISEGRSPMPSYRQSLTEDQRWSLVNYIRTLKK